MCKIFSLDISLPVNIYVLPKKSEEKVLAQYILPSPFFPFYSTKLFLLFAKIRFSKSDIFIIQKFNYEKVFEFCTTSPFIQNQLKICREWLSSISLYSHRKEIVICRFLQNSIFKNTETFLLQYLKRFSKLCFHEFSLFFRVNSLFFVVFEKKASFCNT